MSISEANILKELQLTTVKDGKRIHIYRMGKNGLMVEECLANVYDMNDSVNGTSVAAAYPIKAGRFDENGKLSGVLTIAHYSGDVYSRGGHDSVWFAKADKRKAKKALRAFYKKRMDYYADRITHINEKLNSLKK